MLLPTRSFAFRVGVCIYTPKKTKRNKVCAFHSQAFVEMDRVENGAAATHLSRKEPGFKNVPGRSLSVVASKAAALYEAGTHCHRTVPDSPRLPALHFNPAIQHLQACSTFMHAMRACWCCPVLTTAIGWLMGMRPATNCSCRRRRLQLAVNLPASSTRQVQRAQRMLPLLRLHGDSSMPSGRSQPAVGSINYYCSVSTHENSLVNPLLHAAAWKRPLGQHQHVAGRPLASASAHGARAPVVSVRGNLSLSLSLSAPPPASAPLGNVAGLLVYQ